MHVSGISSAAHPHEITVESGSSRIAQGFAAIGSAIQAGDLAAAQEALLAFEHDLQRNPQMSPPGKLFGENGPLSGDLQTLQIAIQSNDRANARATLKRLADAIEKLIAANK